METEKLEVKDRFGEEISVGDTVVYVARVGSSMYFNRGKVVEIKVGHEWSYRVVGRVPVPRLVLLLDIDQSSFDSRRKGTQRKVTISTVNTVRLG